MNTITPNIGLIKPDHSEASSIDVINVNFDAIDAAIGDIATVESSPTAAAHTVGEYLLYAGHMYRVTSAISAGSSLVLGTNVTPVKFGDELESANTAIKALQDSVAYSGNSASAAINRMDEGSQQFGVVATTAAGHRVALIVQTDGLALYDWNKQGGAGGVWELLTPSVFMGRGLNPSSLTSLDSQNIEAGTYWVNSSYVGGTWPSGRTWGMLLVFRINTSSTLSTQIFIGEGVVYYRQYVNNSWVGWRKLTYES